MTIREKLNANRGVISAVVIVLIVLSIWLSFSRLSSPKRGYGQDAYFSDDDGKSYFKDDISTPVPYKKDGKEVVRAHLFKCPSKGVFVGYLQRYTPEALEALKEAQEAVKAGREPKNMGLVRMIDTDGSEYKKPGAGNPWKRGQSGDVVVSSIMELCDNKPGEFAQNVFP